MIFFGCQKCRNPLEAERSLEEDYVECPKCGHREPIPDHTDPSFRKTVDLEAIATSKKRIILIFVILVAVIAFLLYYSRAS
jgi:DNA-directed RNA polymerase subunit M/transcription elongation factor TFIIS